VTDKALTVALRLLARRDYFFQELATRLISRGFPPEDVERTVRRCAELGYLDDARLARRFVELRAPSKGWGPRRLKAELLHRGVAEEVAEHALTSTAELGAAALARALELVERRARPGWWRLHATTARVISSLVTRGFDPDDAWQAVTKLATQRKAEHDGNHDKPGDPLDVS